MWKWMRSKLSFSSSTRSTSKHMVRQRIDTSGDKTQRLLAYWHQTGFGERISTGEKSYFMTLAA